MKEFLDRDFLLETETAKLLFHRYAEGKPIIDFHNHLSAKEIYEDFCYDNLGEVWLAGDHYKWRAMRLAGIPEEQVTGKADFKEKYKA
ncbi:MAG TPA: glucuronate isomerase, partial [Clostridiales bacterium]|nr:glucuronate isomerase [Clostridiales bacterium]